MQGSQLSCLQRKSQGELQQVLTLIYYPPVVILWHRRLQSKRCCCPGLTERPTAVVPEGMSKEKKMDQEPWQKVGSLLTAAVSYCHVLDELTRRSLPALWRGSSRSSTFQLLACHIFPASGRKCCKPVPSPR